jgi:hypothetical protein
MLANLRTLAVLCHRNCYRVLVNVQTTYFTDWLIAFASMQEIAPDQPGVIAAVHTTRRPCPASGEHVV